MSGLTRGPTEQSLDVLKTNGCNHLDAASIAWNIAEVHELRADLQTYTRVPEKTFTCNVQSPACDAW